MTADAGAARFTSGAPPALLGLRETRALLVGWTLLYGVGSWILEYGYSRAGATRPMPFAAGGKNVVYALVWAPLLVVAIWLTDRWPIRSAADARRMLLHGAAAAAAPFAWGAVAYYACLALVPGWEPWGVWRMYLKTFNGVLYVYTVVVGICHVAYWIRRDRAREVAALQAAQAATEAQLQVLALELHPHFLLNALNSVSALLYADRGRAVEALRGLRAMLDRSARTAAVPEVALGEEIGSLMLYTRIQELRFGKRLALTWRIAPECEAAAVPYFLLQPLVENAIKFSVETLAGRREVIVEATRLADDLVLRIFDDGVGPTGGPSGVGRGSGRGLANARARLQHLYGGRQRLTLTPGPAGRGTIVEVRMPFRIVDRAQRADAFIDEGSGAAPVSHQSGPAPLGTT